MWVLLKVRERGKKATRLAFLKSATRYAMLMVVSGSGNHVSRYYYPWWLDPDLWTYYLLARLFQTKIAIFRKHLDTHPLYTLSLFLIIIMQGKHIISMMQTRKPRLGLAKSHYLCQRAVKHQSQDSTHFCEFPKARSGLSVTPTVLSLTHCNWVSLLCCGAPLGDFFEPELHTYFNLTC